MALLLDSALIHEAQTIRQWGWVKGITTNPSILAKSDRPPEETLRQLAQLSPGELYYQLSARDVDSMIAEGKRASEIIGEKTVLKVPATPLGFQAVAALSPFLPCAVTAIYSASQAAVAAEAGAKYAIAYVHRATRLLGDGMQLVREMAEVLHGSETEILAASLKSPEEAAGALRSGAHHLTLPFEVLQALTIHELSQKTVEEFAKTGVSINF
jgi:transaldolase